MAFEVPNCGRHRIQALLARHPGVRILRRQRRFQLRSREDFCELELDGERFIVSEPWGDSSRFWIGQEPPRPSPALEELRHYLAQS